MMSRLFQIKIKFSASKKLLLISSLYARKEGWRENAFNIDIYCPESLQLIYSTLCVFIYGPVRK